VQNVVLGELVRRRGYGYQLQDRLREVLTDLFGFSDTAVYPALQALAQRGLIVEVDRVPSGRSERWSTQRIIYEATPAGEKHYRAWLSESSRKTPLREELHLKLIGAGPGELPLLLDALDAVEDDCCRRLAEIAARPLVDRHSGATGTGSLGAALVQDALVSHFQTTLEWVERSRSAISNVASTPARPARPQRRGPRR
jgi:DNA-binding PadR family transcriptional regulator